MLIVIRAPTTSQTWLHTWKFVTSSIGTMIAVSVRKSVQIGMSCQIIWPENTKTQSKAYPISVKYNDKGQNRAELSETYPSQAFCNFKINCQFCSPRFYQVSYNSTIPYCGKAFISWWWFYCQHYYTNALKCHTFLL